MEHTFYDVCLYIYKYICLHTVQNHYNNYD